jgi:Lipase (class 3)
MPITDFDIAALCAGIYATPGTPPVVWDHFDPGGDDDICWALKRFPGLDVIVLRGSITLQDWLLDLRADAVPSPLGMVDSGFYAFMPEMWQDAKPMLTQPRVVVAGHSLGAARAAILCGLMTLDKMPPVARVVFGEPKPGFVELAKIIEGTTGRSYRNGDATHHDLVTDVPFSFPPLQYVHPTPIIPITVEPPADTFSSLGVFAWHHASLYAKGAPAIAI